jgi:hypothetical protein
MFVIFIIWRVLFETYKLYFLISIINISRVLTRVLVMPKLKSSQIHKAVFQPSEHRYYVSERVVGANLNVTNFLELYRSLSVLAIRVGTMYDVYLCDTSLCTAV